MSGSFEDRGGRWVVGQVVLTLLYVFAPDIAGRPPWPVRLVLVLLAAPLLITGGIFSGFGVAALGRNLTIFPKPRENAPLKTEGIYGCVRHPIYGGVIMAATGIALATGSIGRLLITLAALYFFDAKSAAEERWLVEDHPEYAEYQRKVRKLLPGLY